LSQEPAGSTALFSPFDSSSE
jgi:hypothetical protein